MGFDHALWMCLLFIEEDALNKGLPAGMDGVLLQIACSRALDNLNLRPRQSINEIDAQPRFRSANRNQDLFNLIAVTSDSVIIGGRDAIYNLSSTSLENKYTIHWKALGQTIEECHMKGKSEAKCHNFIRCREYEFSSQEDRYIEKEQFSGQAISPYDPRHNSTFVYSEELNDIFVGTVSDFGANDALIYRKKLPRGESLRTQKDDRVIEGGRMCASENGGPSPAQDRWSSFLKARLNCSVPADTAPFYFNELQSISSPVDDGKGDTLVYAVFHTSPSLMISAVCSFRMSQVAAIFDHGRFKTQRTPTSLWGPFQKFYSSPAERPGRCVSDSSRLSDVSFIIKNPLMYDLIPSEGLRPLLVEGPGRPALTSIAVAPQVTSVRGQKHDVIYLGRADGTMAKLVESSIDQSSVLVEVVRVFEPSDPIINLQVVPSSDKLVVMGRDQVVRLPLHHCNGQQSCAQCVRLRDPHCAWDVESRACVFNRDWTRGSYVQNILKGISEQCPGTANVLNDDSPSSPYTINEDPNSSNQPQLPDQSALYSAGNLSLIALAVIVSSIGGFAVGYRICKWRFLNKIQRTAHSSGSGSSNGSASDDYDHYGVLEAWELLRFIGKEQHIYSQAPTIVGGGPRSNASTGDAVSLVFGQTPSHFVPLPMITSVSNGGSGIATPRHEARTAMLMSNGMGATLPRDYKVKKVYL
uniref:Sema domain-containing protein n=1 Tax=Ditylenchus dipsaci TaxID=166011 RepID=A0A915DCE0_9BILA